MTLGPFLLRVLLSVGLVLNGGSGWAMSTGHPTGKPKAFNAPAAARLATVDAPAVAPCHEAAGLRATEAHLELPGSPAAVGTGPDESASDCCAASACDCGCLHQSGLAFAPLYLRLPDSHDPQSQVAFAHEHPAPVLAHLIRPPID